MSQPALPGTMTEVWISRDGGPEVLQSRIVPVPKPAVGELLIRIYYDRGDVAPYHTSKTPALDTNKAWHRPD